MNYIILDLEWNQPLSRNSADYRSVGSKLIFELLQIGAIRMDEQLQIVDSFNQLIQPTHYLRLHPRIRRITGIQQEDLCDQPQFAEAVERFHRWCGQDSILITWGCDDISVFQQNLDFFHCELAFPPFYDLQRQYGELIGETKNRAGLHSAMEHFSISADEAHPFHNALNDAWYTARVMQSMGSAQDVLRYPQQARQLIRARKADPRKAKRCDVLRVRGVRDAMKGRHAQQPPCPVCGHKWDLKAPYCPVDGAAQQALAQCPDHGLYTVRVSFQKSANGRREMVRTCAFTDEQNPAYISTKILQWNRKAARLAAAQTEGDTQP